MRAIALLVTAVALCLTPAMTSAVGPDPGKLPQTTTLPSSASPAFRARMAALWRGIAHDAPVLAMSAFFPRSAYLQVKAVADAASDYRGRLVANYRLDIHAAHELLGRGARDARLVGVRVPREWAWIVPGYCANRVGYWHAPGARLLYREGGRLRSFGIFSLISWRGEWYVVHLGIWNQPGSIVSPSSGVGVFGPPGGC